MKPLETVLLNVNGEKWKLEVHKENLPCEKLKSYVVFCNHYDYADCKHTCKYSKKRDEEVMNYG